MLYEMGTRIRQLREEEKLTQEELAKRIHISRASLSLYENGDRNMPISTLIKLAAYFKVSSDYILGIEPQGLSHTSNLTERQKNALQELIYHCRRSNSLKD